MAGLMVMLAVIGIPVSLVAQIHQYDVLTLLHNSEGMGLQNPEQIQAQVMHSLHSYDNGIFVSTIFWGLWLFPFGILVFRSGFLPKFLGVFLMAGCFGYLIEFTVITLWPEFYHASGITNFIHIPSAIGEIGIAFWLLIAGVKIKQ